ncbi:MAG: hypothetical protein RMI85_07590 [Candidatus Korarchaeum sp.]|nr:hypothetical protein [Candidatus Korarchaeum sp.]
MVGYRLAEIAEKQLHLIIAGYWEAVDPDLIEYLEEELGDNPREDPVGVAFCLLKLGIPPERATSLLNWKDFEAFCTRGLQIHGMDALERLRFKQGSKRYEIDVLGVGGDVNLLIDCKMWSAKRRSSKVEYAAKGHLVKAMAFNEAMRSGTISSLEKEEGRSCIVPVIVSWLETGLMRSKEGSAVVSLRNFPRFLESLVELEEEFLRIEADYKIRIKREVLSQRKPPQRS